MLALHKYKSLLAGLAVLVILVSSLSAQTRSRRAVYLTYDDAHPVLQALTEVLPSELRIGSSSEQAAAWPRWVAQRDSEIRNRLVQGDEDTLVNFLLFGTSYTRQPRITPQQVEQMERRESAGANGDAESSRLADILQARLIDLLRASAAPGNNDRVLFARRVLVERRGFNINAGEGREAARRYLLVSLARVLSEQSTYARTLEAARLVGNPSEEFAERSRLYRARGLSSDTSLLPNFAIEESLKAMQSRGLLTTRGVQRIAIIGPGLDFTDKQEGYDFYPQQTIQPFAIVDTLLRLNLAQPESLRVTTFDLSPRVNDHIERARQRAERGQSYVVQLPRDSQAQWKPEAVRYWEQFGDRIGMLIPPAPAPFDTDRLRTRAVSIRPNVVTRITPVDTNIVLQHLDLPPAEKFDLIIATNVFIYYDTLDQSLATINVEQMLKPGGFLLSNNALLELPASHLRSAGYWSVAYSDRPNDGDFIVWYRRSSG